MLFNSEVFLFLFLPVAYAVFWLLRTKRQRYVWLTATGYAFYAGWNWKYCFLMLFSTLVSYGAGLLLSREGWSDARRRQVVLVSVTVDLLLLGFFKYANLTLSTISHAFQFLGTPVHLFRLDILLPIGISFYTFHTITYVVDSYRRVVRPTRDFWEFSSYVSLFSQLVAGPIVRFRQIESDLENIGSTPYGKFFHLGWSFFVIGLCQKVLVADLIAIVIDPALADYQKLGTLTAWICMLGYAYQIYFDFAGYSNMAVGLGYLFGIRIPQNFNTPYKADSISDFWRRWHISISTGLRDYLYIPLGGNRGGPGAAYRNLMLTMLIGGLWHGANWVFVAWGGYHGLLLCLNRGFRGEWESLPVLPRRIIVFVLVIIGWVLFRSVDFPMALALYGKMFSLQPSAELPAMAGSMVALLAAFAFAHFGKNTFEMTHEWGLPMRCVLLFAFAVCIVRIMTWQNSPFLYFQF
jgi:alginate O-acetyltransferase complex protein AlgI